MEATVNPQTEFQTGGVRTFNESRATYTPRTATLATLRNTDRRIQYETFFCDQRNTLLYRTLADEAHPFNPIQEEAQC